MCKPRGSNKHDIMHWTSVGGRPHAQVGQDLFFKALCLHLDPTRCVCETACPPPPPPPHPSLGVLNKEILAEVLDPLLDSALGYAIPWAWTLWEALGLRGFMRDGQCLGIIRLRGSRV